MIVLLTLLTGISLLMMSCIFLHRGERLWLRIANPDMGRTLAFGQWVIALALFLASVFLIDAPTNIMLVGALLIMMFLIGVAFRPLAVREKVPYLAVGLLSLVLGSLYICVSGMVFARAFNA